MTFDPDAHTHGSFGFYGLAGDPRKRLAYVAKQYLHSRRYWILPDVAAVAISMDPAPYDGPSREDLSEDATPEEVSAFLEAVSESLSSNVEGDSILPWVAVTLNRFAKAGDEKSYALFLDAMTDEEIPNPYAEADEQHGRGDEEELPLPVAIYRWMTQEGVNLMAQKDPGAVFTRVRDWYAPPPGQVVYEFDDGWTVRQIGDVATQGPEVASEELVVEGNLLDHCIGNPDFQHYHQILQGTYKGFSLRDEDGVPRVAFKVGQHGDIVEARAAHNAHPSTEEDERIGEFAEAAGFRQGTTAEHLEIDGTMGWAGILGDALALYVRREGELDHPNVTLKGPEKLSDVPTEVPDLRVPTFSITVEPDTTWDVAESPYDFAAVSALQLLWDNWQHYIDENGDEDTWLDTFTEVENAYLEHDWDTHQRSWHKEDLQKKAYAPLKENYEVIPTDDSEFDALIEFAPEYEGDVWEKQRTEDSVYPIYFDGWEEFYLAKAYAALLEDRALHGDLELPSEKFKEFAEHLETLSGSDVIVQTYINDEGLFIAMDPRHHDWGERGGPEDPFNARINPDGTVEIFDDDSLISEAFDQHLADFYGFESREEGLEGPVDVDPLVRGLTEVYEGGETGYAEGPIWATRQALRAMGFSDERVRAPHFTVSVKGLVGEAHRAADAEGVLFLTNLENWKPAQIETVREISGERPELFVVAHFD